MRAPKYIYFLKPVGMVGPIKIGSSAFVNDRITQISAWSPFPLELVYSEIGLPIVERTLHRHFAEYHSHLEWFHPGHRLLAALERMKAGEKIADAVDLTVKSGSIFDRNGRKAKAPKPFTSTPSIHGELQ